MYCLERTPKNWWDHVLFLRALPLLVSELSVVCWFSFVKLEETISFLKASGFWEGGVVVGVSNSYLLSSLVCWVFSGRIFHLLIQWLSFPRMGWFVPSSVVQELWTQNITADHWKALLINSVARAFSWWGRSEWRELCPSCEMLAYRSLHCTKSRKRKNCATLFASVKG